jgi:hypothetical protein
MSCTSFECIVHVYNIPSFKFSNHVIITACIFGFKILSYSWPSKRKVQIVVSLNICLCVCCIGWFCTVFMPLPYFCSFSQIKDWKLFHIHQILASIKVKILKYCKCGIIQIALWIAHLRKKDIHYITSTFHKPKCQSGWNFVCPVSIQLSSTLLCRPVSTLHMPYLNWQSHNTFSYSLHLYIPILFYQIKQIIPGY